MENIDQDIWRSLKEEMKSELKNELKEELISECRDEIVASAMNKVEDLIFKEHYFEKMLRAYIKSRCHDDIYFQKMVILGKVGRGKTNYEIPEFSEGSIWMPKKKNIDLIKLYNEYLEGKFIDCSLDEFLSLINFNHSNITVEWTDKKRKTFTYSRLFELYNRVYEEDFTCLSAFLKSRFINFLSIHFTFGGETKMPNLITKRFNVKYPPSDKN